MESETPISIYSDAFSNSYNATLYVPKGSKAAYQAANYWKDFNAIVEYAANITFADANVKAICVQNWDTNNDGELNTDEAAAVRNLGSVFENNTDITSFDELQYFTGLTSMGDDAFRGCSGLTSVTIPNSVTSIGSYAFVNCSGLTSVTIPNSVTSIGNDAFFGCSGLTEVIIPNPVTSIGDFAFSHCLALTSFTIPESLSCINNSLFWYCPSLASVTIPENITTIESLAFQDCTALTSITIPKSVTSIGDGIFAGCNSLATIVVDGDNPVYDSRENCNSIIETSTNTLIQGCMNSVIPENVTSVGKYAFLRFLSLSSITIPKSVAYMGDAAFHCTHFEGVSGLLSIKMNSAIPITIHEDCFNEPPYYFATLYVPKGSKAAYQAADYWKEFKHIEEYEVKDIVTFADENVKAICVQNWDTDGDGELSMDEAAAVTELGRVFEDNTTITSFDELQYFTGLTSIGLSAFSGCSGLSSVTIPNGVTYIDCCAFQACYGLTTIDMPNRVARIEFAAFTNCSGLTSVTFPDSLSFIASEAFYGCSSLTSLNIPNSVTSIEHIAFGNCASLSSIVVEAGNPVYDSRDNCNAVIQTESNELIIGCKNTVIPNSVTSIIYTAFRGCTGLTSVTIPNSVTSIGEAAFSDCSGLTSVTIPNSVTSIGGYAFEGTAWYESQPDGVVYAGEVAYMYKGTMPSDTNITLREGTVGVGGNAFSGNNGLTSVTIPNSVTSIGWGAFSSCSGLTSVKVGMENPVSIDAGTFTNSANATLYVPAGSKGAYEAADYWNEFKEIVEYGAKENITFADANVKAICVQNWDTDGDGELSLVEAAAVTSINNNSGFRGNDDITSFDELQYFTGLTSIGDYAFDNCDNVKSITFPNNLKRIGNGAFKDCDGLASVTIPASVTEISEAFDAIAFYRSSGITSIVVEEGNPVYDSRDNCNAIIKTATNKLIMGCRNTVIPEGIDTIGMNAFDERLQGVTSIRLPNSVSVIEHGAFVGGGDLTTLVLSENLKSIGSWSITSNKLSYLYLPESLTEIGVAAFYLDNDIKAVKVGMKTPVYVDTSWSFPSRRNATLYVPRGSKEAYETATCWKDFKEILEYDENITFADANVKAICVQNWDSDEDGELIADEAAAVTDLGTVFQNNGTITSFDELQYFTGLTSIGEYAFCSCSSLTSITIPNSVTSIGDYAFASCEELTSIIIPTSVTSIGNEAFARCYGLTSITLPNSVTSIGNGVLVDCPSLLYIEVDADNSSFVSEDGVLFNIDKTSIFRFPQAKIVSTYSIPNSVTSIEPTAFSGCSNLTSITIPNSVTSIGYCAFSDCMGLTSVTIPNSVTVLDGTFLGCTGLTSVTIPNSVTYLECTFAGCTNLTEVTLGSSLTDVIEAFRGCESLTKVNITDLAAWCNISFINIYEGGSNPLFYAHQLYLNGEEVKDLVIPNSVTSIGNSVFSDCSGLTSVTIPNSVTSIGYGAFSDCSGLTSVKVGFESPLSIYSSTFSNRANTTLYVPKGSEAAYEAADYWKEFKAIVEFPDADVNQDGEIDVVDVVDIARFVVGTPGDTFVEFLADLNSDDEVNVADAVVLVNEIAGDVNFAKAYGAPRQDLGDDRLTLTKNADHSLSLAMESLRPYTAFQFDLYTNSEDDVMNLRLNTARKNGHQLLYNKVDEGHYRVVALSLANSGFNGNNGELLKIQLDGFNSADMTIGNIHFITTDGTDYRFDDLSLSSATGIESLTPVPSPEGEGNVYDLSGRKVSESSVLPKGVYVVNGRKKVVR